MASLSKEQLERLKRGIRSCYAFPFIDDVEDFVFEGVFCFTLGIPVPNTIDIKRTKRLFDVIENSSRIGWSCKTLVWKLEPGTEFELVIQRADVFDKAKELGFPGLTRDSHPDQIGAAVLEHWNLKIKEDMKNQGIDKAYIAVLLKSKDRKKFYIYKDELHIYNKDEIEWSWSDPNEKIGLKGIHKSTKINVFKWYANQKQLFERFKLPDELDGAFTLQRTQLEAGKAVQLLCDALDQQPPLTKT